MVEFAIRYLLFAICSKQQKVNSKKRQKGFTLIELLVTISIIAILAVIGLAAYGVFTKSARDARRESDLKFIQSALEQYHADQKYYPVSGSLVQGQSFTSATGAKSPLPATPRIYLNNTPVDPLSTQSYLYSSYKDNAGTSECVSTDAGNCVKYCIFAKQETKIANEFPPGCSSPAYNYAVTSP